MCILLNAPRSVWDVLVRAGLLPLQTRQFSRLDNVLVASSFQVLAQLRKTFLRPLLLLLLAGNHLLLEKSGHSGPLVLREAVVHGLQKQLKGFRLRIGKLALEIPLI